MGLYSDEWVSHCMFSQMFNSCCKIEISRNRLGTDIQNANHVVASCTTMAKKLSRLGMIGEDSFTVIM